MPTFVRYIGIDYSGAQTPTASLNGLRVSLRAPAPAQTLPDDAAQAGARDLDRSGKDIKRV